MNIRGSSADEVVLVVEGKELGTMERWRAMQAAHEGAVYLHRGVTYVSEKLDLDTGRAHLVHKDVTYYTQPISQSVLEPLVDFQLGIWGRHDVRLCSIRVTDLVLGYKVKSLDGDSILATNILEMPPMSYETVGVRLDLPAILSEDEVADSIAALHGLEHSLLAVAPLIAGCDRGDIGSSWYAAFPENLRPTLFVFDRIPGGVGIAEKLFQNLGAWTSAATQLLKSCDCTEGCPACLLSARCEANNESLNKAGALGLLRELR